MTEPKVVASYSNSRAKQKTYGLTSEELAEAMTMYVEAKASEASARIIGSFEKEHDRSLGDLHKIVVFFMSRAFESGFTEGMKLGENTYDLVHFYKDAKDRKATSLVDTYEFGDFPGVSGILFGDGTFQKCGNAQHQFLLVDIAMDVQMACIYFSKDPRNDGGGVVSHSPVGFNKPTKSQLRWITEHWEYFDREQKRTTLSKWREELKKSDKEAWWVL